MTIRNIVNGRVVTPNGVIIGGVSIQDGHILHVGADSSLPPGEIVYDAGGNYIIPGLIDPHVHLNSDEPGTPFERYARDFETETRGAVYGGVTCFLTRIASLGSYKEIFETVVKWGNENSYVDFILNAAVFTAEHISEQEWLTDRGLAAFKHFFTAYRGQEGIQKGLQPVDAGLLYESFENLGRIGRPAVGLVHAEQMDIIDVLRARLEGEGRQDLSAWTESRPWFTELIQIEAAALVAETTGAAMYLPHLTIGRGIEAVERYQSRGVKLYAETCPHYLVFTKDDSDLESWGKVVPPLRTREDQEALWDGIRRGIITLIGTDHCPYSRDSKEQRLGRANLWTAMPGFNNGMEHMLPLMWTHGVAAGRITVEEFVRICSQNAAETFNIFPRKGALVAGADADVVVIDPNMEATIDPDFYHTRSPEWSAYYGQKVKGMAVLTMVRGEVLMKDRELVGSPSHGRYVAMQKI